jgi:hypothetical protein
MIVAAHKIDRVDGFVLLDTVQFKKGEWQNRNRIKTAAGWQWLTVPILHDHGQSIREVRIDPTRENWGRKHHQALRTNYASTPFFDWVKAALDPVWEREWELLSLLNRATVEVMTGLLGITTPLYEASQLGETPEHPDERLIELCRRLGADTYLAGAGGPAYMEGDRWERAGIRVEVQRFVHPEYGQPFGDFLPAMSAVDLLCNCGPGALALLRRTNGRPAG